MIADDAEDAAQTATAPAGPAGSKPIAKATCELAGPGEQLAQRHQIRVGWFVPPANALARKNVGDRLAEAGDAQLRNTANTALTGLTSRALMSLSAEFRTLIKRLRLSFSSRPPHLPNL